MTDFEAKLNFLKSPASYGDGTTPVDCIETHMSWVFLVGDVVYKLKKAVVFPFLDFSSLAARAFYCHEEVRLNARLAPDIYQSVVALKYREGTFSLVPEARLPAPGDTVDWLVVMHRLPEHQMLSHRIVHHPITPKDLEPLAAVLASFYKSAKVMALDAKGYLGRFERELALNRTILLRPAFQLHDADNALTQGHEALHLCTNLLRERVAHQRVVDGHGDLRPEHVCLLEKPVVIDCLEFNPQFRQLDPFDEISQLGLECAMLGASWVGPYLVSKLAAALGDHVPAPLIHFYTGQRALLRARLAMAHLLDDQPRLPDKWPPLAQRYIAQALQASQALKAAMPHGRLE